MDLKKIKKISSAASFEDLIAAAYLIANEEQHIALKLRFNTIWERLRQAHKLESLRSGKLTWITTWKGSRAKFATDI